MMVGVNPKNIIVSASEHGGYGGHGRTAWGGYIILRVCCPAGYSKCVVATVSGPGMYQPSLCLSQVLCLPILLN